MDGELLRVILHNVGDGEAYKGLVIVNLETKVLDIP